MSSLLFKRAWGALLLGDCFPATVEEESVLCLSLNVINSKGDEQDQAGQGQSYSHGTYLAKTSLVPVTVHHILFIEILL